MDPMKFGTSNPLIHVIRESIKPFIVLNGRVIKSMPKLIVLCIPDIRADAVPPSNCTPNMLSTQSDIHPINCIGSFKNP
jgi:hypothetical protein